MSGSLVTSSSAVLAAALLFNSLTCTAAVCNRACGMSTVRSGASWALASTLPSFVLITLVK
eukprot:3453148-Lingulodinium_polyedra.AAC.1